MVDLFNEVSEDLRRDRLNRLWARYGLYVIALAVLIVLATAGWRAWLYYEKEQADATAVDYIAAVAKANEGDHKAAIAALDAVAAKGPSGYTTLARFRAAAETMASGDGEGALKAWQALADDRSLSTELKDLARYRAAMIAVDSEDYDTFSKRVASLTTDGNPWKPYAEELKAISAIKVQKWEDARTALEAITHEMSVPQDVESRAQILMELVTGKIGPKPDAAGGNGEKKEGSGT